MHGGEMNMKKDVCPMKCCKNSVKSSKPKKAGAKFLCRALGCSQDTPTNTAQIAQVNLTPVIIATEKKSLFEILFSTSPKEDAQPSIAELQRQTTSQPKYIQHQRILV